MYELLMMIRNSHFEQFLLHEVKYYNDSARLANNNWQFAQNN